ncbi:hypothetical protein [Nocardia arthritidis]|uniref:Uncharacterized protein n=1 Tax=Nocardia arthritidis TaxID=228602 RepID=A0A6G9Y4Q4_9NOCA|nr:hypothetical protein [Nocardia arthritidis]QIS08215.1 hypothetical protein F5544_01460 [Nocardia arthritidis]
MNLTRKQKDAFEEMFPPFTVDEVFGPGFGRMLEEEGVSLEQTGHQLDEIPLIHKLDETSKPFLWMFLAMMHRGLKNIDIEPETQRVVVNSQEFFDAVNRGHVQIRGALRWPGLWDGSIEYE